MPLELEAQRAHLDLDQVTTVTIVTGSSVSPAFSVAIKTGSNRTGQVTASANGLTTASFDVASS